jgi:hypothetical protein
MPPKKGDKPKEKKPAVDKVRLEEHDWVEQCL